MSWNLQSLNQHNNPTVYPFGNAFTPSTQQYPSNASQQYQNNQMNQYTNNNRNTFGINNINTLNTINTMNTPTTTNTNNRSIPLFSQNQLKNIELPPLPKELQLVPPSQFNRNQNSNRTPSNTLNPFQNNHISQINGMNNNNYNNPMRNNQFLKSLQINNLVPNNSVNQINSIHPSLNGLNRAISNGHTININNVNNINNIKNVNINQNGTIHNTINPNYIINNIVNHRQPPNHSNHSTQNNPNILQQIIMKNTASSQPQINPKNQIHHTKHVGIPGSLQPPQSQQSQQPQPQKPHKSNSLNHPI